MREIKKIIPLLLTAMLALVFNVQPTAAVNWWPMFHHDPNHTGYSTSAAPDTNNLLWRYTTGGAVSSSPAVVDGKVYVGSSDNKVYCLNASTGAKIWTYATDGEVHSSPAVVDGKVYVGSYDYKLYCLPGNDPNGNGFIDPCEAIWYYQTGGRVETSPVVADGKVYIGSNDYRVYCLPASDPNGDGVIDNNEVIWQYLTGGGVQSSPAVANGKVYFGGQDCSPVMACLKTYCLPTNDPNGDGLIDEDEVIWKYTTYDYVTSSPAVADGKVFVAPWAHICALPAEDPNGDGVIDSDERLWCYPVGCAMYSSPAVADGKVYVGANDYGRIYCLPVNDPNGDGIIESDEVVWTCATSVGTVRSSPAVADDKVYVGSHATTSYDSKVYCLPASDPNGDGVIDNNEVIWSYRIPGRADLRSSPAVADGKLYIGADDSKIYAFGLGGLHLLSPNGGEGLLAGTNYSIQWETMELVSDVLIKYSTNDGLSWMEVDPCNTGNSGTYNWLVPTLTSDQCLVRISDANDANDIDTSDYTFGICECQKTITADMTGNCYVDWADLGIFTDQWLANDCGEPNWCGRRDFDKSGTVALGDFSIFAGQWQECGNPFDPVCGTPPPWQSCWDCPYQCHGDADCLPQGKQNWRVSTNDAFILVASWMKSYGKPGYDACADFDRDGDVDWDDEEILETWWQVIDVPADCPTEP